MKEKYFSGLEKLSSPAAYLPSVFVGDNGVCAKLISLTEKILTNKGT